MKERLMLAYFTEGRSMASESDLAELASQVGLDHDEVLRVLREGRYLDAVEADQQQAAAIGIRGVPFFVIDSRYGISGAQDPSAFAEVLRKARDEQEAVA
jgi:Predicted dithiol-disulfide isomerase involved in polyketide biosynthesis